MRDANGPSKEKFPLIGQKWFHPWIEYLHWPRLELFNKVLNEVVCGGHQWRNKVGSQVCQNVTIYCKKIKFFFASRIIWNH